MISTLAKQLVSDFLQALPKLDIEKTETLTQLQTQLRRQFEATIKKMNMVPREEFDAQITVLNHTIAQVKCLEEQLAELTTRDTETST